ncbi:hypothetical protein METBISCDRAFT_26068 [Metschnikowia bicuspidata]|uniref:SH3 domain-containing protein n=1 Tax=Metschnikowia bicuspidata TaxID=27322 RepID=A0A4V1J3H9_9ASCO|nr:hypothetical protein METBISCDRAFT_26068 [Metschnikowia bicuspidata]
MELPFTVRSVLEYKSEYEDDLTFRAGAVITVTAIEDQDWYTGTFDGRTGMFPKSFVKLERSGVAPVEREGQERVGREAAVDEMEQVELEVEEEAGELEPVLEAQSYALKPAPSDSLNTVKAELKRDLKEVLAGLKKSPKEVAKEAAKKVPPVRAPGAIPPKQAKPTAAMPSVPVTMPQNLRKDPYAINKQFIGAGKSSYVPPVAPRDQSNVVHGFHDVVSGAEIVRADDAKDEPAEPNLSLKERIALLHNSQREELEKSARKKKEKEKKAALKSQNTAFLLESATVSGQATGNTDGDASLGNVDVNDGAREIEAVLHEESDEAPDEEKEDVDQDEGEEEDGEDDENEKEEDEDEEDARRRRLVERMAKISGGRNMFGMMGMAGPFGAPVETALKKPKAAKRSASTKPALASPSAVASAPEVPPSALPLPGMAVFGKPKGDVSAGQGYASDGPGDASDFQGDAHDARFEDTAAGVDAGADVGAESAGTKEEENVSNRDAEHLGVSLETSVRAPLLLEAFLPPRTGAMPANMQEAVLYSESTSWDADEEVSDLGGIAVQNEHLRARSCVTRVKVPPPPPVAPLSSAAALPVPSVPSVPPIPATSSLPLVPRAAPPVPNAAPPVPNAAPPVPKAAPPVPKAVPPGAPLVPAPGKIIAHPPVPFLPKSYPVFPGIPSAKTVNTHISEAQTVGPDDECDAAAELHFGDAPRTPAAKATTFAHASHDAESPCRSSIEGVSRTLPMGSKSSVCSTRSDVDAAEKDLGAVRDEVSPFDASSEWWAHGKLPQCLRDHFGKDLMYEVDTHEMVKRGGRVVVYKDYYIIYADLSQLLIDVQYDKVSPRDSVVLGRLEVRPPPQFRKLLLQEYSSSIGALILQSAQRLQELQLPTGVVTNVFINAKINFPWILPPVGNTAFGATVYESVGHQVTVYDAIRPGDIVCMNQAWFSSGEGLFVVGEKANFPAVVVEYDAAHNTLHAIENDEDGNGSVRTYNLGDILKGHVRVFRAVKREYMGW